ncbi:hypothetical protein F8388_018371 [Cannabis sativa]|uniref:Uncharacterized protein n=1 Tax=Cannabis sativa TaxID=3483 RepID=A0A7J6HHL9_CANSA|nr:hypothetical protein F8388_018371 [Cannabis sativa]
MNPSPLHRLHRTAALQLAERKRLTNVEGFNNAIDEAIERSRNAQDKVVL